MAHCVISLLRSDLVAFGVKRTLSGFRCAPNLSRLTRSGPSARASKRSDMHDLALTTDAVGGADFLQDLCAPLNAA